MAMPALTRQRFPVRSRNAPRTVTPSRAPQLTHSHNPGRPSMREPWRPHSVWREQARSRLADLRVQLDELDAGPKSDTQCGDARRQLDEAMQIIDAAPRLRSMWTGIDVQATWFRIHAVDAAVIRFAKPQVVRAKLPGIVADGAELLGVDHPRVVTLRELATQPEWDCHARETITHSVKAVYDASDSENMRLRSFRNLLLGGALALAVIAVGVAAVDFASHTKWGWSAAMTKGDEPNILVIELLGLVSASLVGAVALRRMQGTSTAYGIPMATMLFKLPAGALTAVAGVLMIKAGVTGPALTGTSGAHAMGYALLLGASQQGITGLVDRQAQKVLNGISSKDNA
jgi:hypothetical protein